MNRVFARNVTAVNFVLLLALYDFTHDYVNDREPIQYGFIYYLSYAVLTAR